MHPFLTEQLATARLAEFHADAERRRTVRDADAGRRRRFWRRPPPGPPPRVVVDLTQRAADVTPTDALRPVA